MRSVAFLCLSLAVLGAKAGAPEVNFIEPCRFDDSECLLKSSRKAMPYILDGLTEYDIPSFKPLVLKNVRGDNGELKLFFENMAVTTLSNCEIVKVVRSEKLKLTIELVCPITVIGNYSASGKLGFLDIIGNGGFRISSDEISITVTATLKKITKNDQEYYKLTGFDFSYEARKQVRFELDNLFDGDKQKAGPVLEFMNTQWKDIVEVLGRPLIKEIITQIVHHISKIFAKIPCNELELD